MAAASYSRDADGSKFIPATQRPDGTWRKPRRIREGYVPQEEVPLYESKGKQFLARQTGLPVGLTLEAIATTQKAKKQTPCGMVQPIPGLILNVEKKKKKKKKSASDEIGDKLSKCVITEPTFSEQPQVNISETTTSQDPTKRLKYLRKKLREIESLEERIKTGMLKTPDKDQKEKMSRKDIVLKEIQSIEKQVSE